MRFLLLVCLCLTASTGQQTSPTPAPGSSAGSNQQKARTIIDQMIAALGGQAYLNVQDSYSEGRYGRFHNEVMVGQAKYFRYWRWPDSDRWEITDQRDIVQLYIGDKATEVTWQGARIMNPEKEDNVRQWLIRRHYALEIVLRTWLNQPGTLLLYEGSSLAENRMAERITIINPQNEAVTLLVSQDTHLPVQKIFTVRDPQTRDRDEEIEIFDSWRVVQGINTPFNDLIKRNGQIVRQQFVFNVTYNNHPPDSIFEPKLIRNPKK
jgi:hypothetical protein